MSILASISCFAAITCSISTLIPVSVSQPVPIVDVIADTTAYEDVLLEKLLTVNDKDLKTFRSDKFSYALTTIKVDTNKTPIDSTVVTGLTAVVTQSGKVSFTPTKLDTGYYAFRVEVTDDWALKDTVDIKGIGYYTLGSIRKSLSDEQKNEYLVLCLSQMLSEV